MLIFLSEGIWGYSVMQTCCGKQFITTMQNIIDNGKEAVG